MRAIFCFLFIMAAASMQPLQAKYEIELCCTTYKRGIIYFNAINYSDSAVRFRFAELKKVGKQNLISATSLINDTLNIHFYERLEGGVRFGHGSDKVRWYAGELVNHLTWEGHQALTIGVKLKRRVIKDIRFISLTLPDGQKIGMEVRRGN